MGGPLIAVLASLVIHLVCFLVDRALMVWAAKRGKPIGWTGGRNPRVIIPPNDCDYEPRTCRACGRSDGWSPPEAEERIPRRLI